MIFNQCDNFHWYIPARYGTTNNAKLISGMPYLSVYHIYVTPDLGCIRILCGVLSPTSRVTIRQARYNEL